MQSVVAKEMEDALAALRGDDPTAFNKVATEKFDWYRIKRSGFVDKKYDDATKHGSDATSRESGMEDRGVGREGLHRPRGPALTARGHARARRALLYGARTTIGTGSASMAAVRSRLASALPSRLRNALLSSQKSVAPNSFRSPIASSTLQPSTRIR